MATGRDRRRKRRPKGKLHDPVQSERFIDSAKALGVKESDDAFHKAMRALLELKPKRKRRDG